MKLFCKDWLFLFISLAIGGIGMLQPIHPWIGHALIIVAFLGILSILAFNIYRTQFKKQAKIPVDQNINNPKDFPALNLPALKRHVSLIINDPKHSFNRLIRSVVLYRGVDDFKYVLGVEIPPTISIPPSNDHKALTNHWAFPQLSNFVDDDFRKEVYRKESDADADFSLTNWIVLTIKPNKKIPKEVALEKYRWVLYKKH